jgi:thiamine kinase-like enzyme
MVDLRDTNGPDCADLGGPFKSMRERYLYHIDGCLAAIKGDKLFRQDSLLAYLTYLELREMVASSSLLAEDDDREYYLRHPDAAPDNMLIAEHGEITALLDWEW